MQAEHAYAYRWRLGRRALGSRSAPGGRLGLAILLPGVVAAAAVSLGGCGIGTGERNADQTELRMRVVSDDGLFLVYDAAIPADAPRKSAGYLAYWNDYASRQAYIFQRLLFNPQDVGHALLNLERDFGTAVDPLAGQDALLEQGLQQAAEVAIDPTPWVNATEQIALAVMGRVPASGSEVSTRIVDSGECLDFLPPKSVLPPLEPPPLFALPKEVMALAIRAATCDGGGGCNWPSGCGGDPCIRFAKHCDGRCTKTLLSGNACDDDGNPCTTDICVSGVCQHPNGGTGCPSDGEICTNDVCNNGNCEHQPVPDWIPCPDDDRACTADYCWNAVCSHFVDCDDNNECTSDFCNASDNCDHSPLTGPACGDDDSPCTDDVCINGTCEHPGKDCDDDNECTADSCNELGNCVNAPLDGAGCDTDDNACTTDVCSGSTCTHPPIDCDDDNECTNDSCDTQDGCVNDPLSGGACDDGDPCTVDSCDPASGCQHSPLCGTGKCCEGACCSGPPSSASMEPCCEAPPPAIICCPDNACCLGVCINEAECCAGRPCPLPDGTQVCCDECDNCAATGCCPPGGVVCPDGSCCNDGAPCTTDICECADSSCTTYTCGTQAVCDDGNPCTDDVCTPDTCDNPICSFPCLADCTSCPGGLCENCACVQEPCSVSLREITFQNDHTMYEETAPCSGALCWGSGAAITGVDWASLNDPDHPVAYTRGTGMQMVVRMDVTGGAFGTATLRLTGPDGVTGAGTFNIPCQTTEERFVTITTTALPNVVKAYTPAGLSWSVQCPGDATFRAVGVTSHRIYVTYGMPGGSVPTNRRLNMVCNAAWQAGSALEVIEGVAGGGEGIHKSLDAFPPHDGCPQGSTCIDDWRLMKGWPFSGECDQQAHFMNLALQMIGTAAGTEYLTFASTDATPTDREFTTAAALGITQDLDGDGIVGEIDEVLELIFDFDPPAADRKWNNFEGSLVAGGKYYSAWPSLKADSPCRLLLEVEDVVGAEQFWIYRGPTGGILYHYPTKVPFPTCP